MTIQIDSKVSIKNNAYEGSADPTDLEARGKNGKVVYVGKDGEIEVLTNDGEYYPLTLDEVEELPDD